MIKLHQFARAFGLPNPSPFCIKVETYLRLAGIPYEIVLLGDPSKAPKGKGPYIEDDGQIIPDSHFIIAHLKRKHGDPLGQGLTAAERAHHHAIQRMCDAHLYFTLVPVRWLDPVNAPKVREEVLRFLPGLVRPLVMRLAQRKVRQMLWMQGTGRHSTDEVNQLAIEDIAVLATLLGDKPFFGGERPREVDCVAWAYIVSLIDAPLPHPIRDAACKHANLVAYSARMWERAFSDLPRPSGSTA